jgi:CheY-like chemotaxis protein
VVEGNDEVRSTPVVAIAAFAMKGDEQKIRSSGCEVFIAKPISVGNFLGTVAEISLSRVRPDIARRSRVFSTSAAP